MSFNVYLSDVLGDQCGLRFDEGYKCGARDTKMRAVAYLHHNTAKNKRKVGPNACECVGVATF